MLIQNYSGVGLSLVIMGQFIRSLSMYTAKSSFNHYIQKEKKATTLLLALHLNI